MKFRNAPLLICSAALLLSGCGEDSAKSDATDKNATQETKPLVVPDGFDYNMNRDITLRVQVLDHNGNPGKQVGVQVYQPDNFKPSEADQATPAAAPLPDLISRGQTDSQGFFEQQIRLPGHLTHLKVQVSQLGIHNVAELEINTDTIFHEFK